jgi:ABC-type lipoprotein export system ATPase subunit
VVIMGPSGCGKSSLLRVIGGLWPIISGSVTRPDKIGRDGMYFLPQRSYVFSSTLIEQITYPISGTTDDISKLKELIKEVGLGHLTKRLESGEIFDWGSVLSTSEMQRLSFARLFYHNPNFCLMDEATSAMDLHMENKCLKKCAKMGITLISVAHRPTVIPHHESVFSYVTSTRSWDTHDAREVQEAVMLPSSVLEDQPTIEGSDELEELAADKPPAGIGKLFYTRLVKSMSYCCGWKSWPTIFFTIIFFMMGGYGALQIIILNFTELQELFQKFLLEMLEVPWQILWFKLALTLPLLPC